MRSVFQVDSSFRGLTVCDESTTQPTHYEIDMAFFMVPLLRQPEDAPASVRGKPGEWGPGRVCSQVNVEKNVAGVLIRLFRLTDLEAVKVLTVHSFSGVTLEQNVEGALGVLNGHDWRWRKSRHIDDDVAANPEGIFVAEREGRIVGYITTLVDRDAGKGRIPNLAVALELRGMGLGRQLIERALEYFRGEGLSYAMIETMDQNEIGRHLYPACGFVEVARQVHFARKL